MLVSLKKFLTGTLALVTAVFFLFFAVVNRETVSLQLTPLPYIIEMRLFVVIGVLVLFGTLLGWLVASFECRKRHTARKETRQRLIALEEENAALRSRYSLPEYPAQGA